MGLQAQPPLRMREAVLDGRAGVRVAVGSVHRLQEEVREVEVLDTARADRRLLRVRRASARRRDSSDQVGLRLRADADPVERRAGTGRVPLVSMATVNPACVQRVDQPARRAAAAARRRCRRRSGSVAGCGRPRPLDCYCRGQHRPRCANCPPPGPSVPTKSVSQNWQMAVARSPSRPVHRLQPAKRQNTAGRPACAPSPCRV